MTSRPFLFFCVSVLLAIGIVACDGEEPQNKPFDSTEQPTQPENPNDPNNSDVGMSNTCSFSDFILGDWLAMNDGKDWIKLHFSSDGQYLVLTSDNINDPNSRFYSHSGKYTVDDSGMVIHFLPNEEPDVVKYSAQLKVKDTILLGFTADFISETLKSEVSEILKSEDRFFSRVLGSYLIKKGETINPDYSNYEGILGSTPELSSISPEILSVNSDESQITAKGEGIAYVKVGTKEWGYIEIVSSYFYKLPYNFFYGVGNTVEKAQAHFKIKKGSGIDSIVYITSPTTTLELIDYLYVRYSSDFPPYLIWKILSSTYIFYGFLDRDRIGDFIDRDRVRFYRMPPYLYAPISIDWDQNEKQIGFHS